MDERCSNILFALLCDAIFNESVIPTTLPIFLSQKHKRHHKLAPRDREGKTSARGRVISCP